MYYRLYSDFPFPYYCLFLVPGSHPGCHIALSTNPFHNPNPIPGDLTVYPQEGPLPDSSQSCQGDWLHLEGRGGSAFIPSAFPSVSLGEA